LHDLAAPPGAVDRSRIDLLAFRGVSMLVIASPGQDTALTIRNTLAGGRAAGQATAAGVAGGQAVWTLAASAGVAALLVASEPAFLALKLIGAAYLVWLGLHSLWHAFAPGPGALAGDSTAPGLQPRKACRQGFVSNLGNPKMAIFFTSLLPQFGGGSFAALALLGLVFCGLTLAWLSGYAFLVAKAGHVLRRPRFRRAVDGLLGSALVGLGARLATLQR
jgi:threonine/homoserine/homoserine lactone efflux protein